MTTKEKNSEMMEIFVHRASLHEKIRWNSQEVLKIELSENSQSQEMKAMAAKGKKILLAHKKELTKLSSRKIALQTGMSLTTVTKKYGEFLNSRAFEVMT